MNEPQLNWEYLDRELKLLVKHAQDARDAFIERDFDLGFAELLQASTACANATREVRSK